MQKYVEGQINAAIIVDMDKCSHKLGYINAAKGVGMDECTNKCWYGVMQCRDI